MSLILANLNTSSIIRTCMAVDASIALADDNRRMDVSVGTLGKGDLLDETVHKGVELAVLSNGIDGGAGFKPLVHVAVVKRGTMVFALDGAGSHLKVAKTVRAVLAVGIERFPRCVPSVPHLPHASAVHGVKDIAPEATSPSDGAHGEVVHLSLGTTAHVGEALGGESCCDTATNETY